jgi:hypothetical protein
MDEMKKVIVNSILFLLLLSRVFACETGQFSQMSHQEIDSLLTQTASSSMTITDKMNFYSRFFLGTSYNFACVGEGQYALLETYPLVNFNETNCMAMCEHILALAISDSWDNFFNNLQQIRYKDGMIGMRTRNHYTMGDWLPENNWLLEDVSGKVGGPYAKTLTRVISHKNFFKGKGINDLRYVKPDREITIDYIPSEALEEIKSNLRVGDIGALLLAKKNNIFSGHMWMVAEEEGDLIIRESSTSKMSTFDTPYMEWVEKIKTSSRYLGIALMRIKDELNQPGKIILPWDIVKLKK